METRRLICVLLPTCLADIVIDYFGRATDPREMATLGQWEDCMLLSSANRDELFYGACAGGHLAIVAYAIARRADDWRYGLAFACQGGHLNIVELMIAHGADDWNLGLAYACKGGQSAIAGLMIAHGANRWDWGLLYACQSGHFTIVEFMIARGANNWNWGLGEACRGGHPAIVKLMIDHGATQCQQCNKSIAEHLAKCLPKP